MKKELNSQLNQLTKYRQKTPDSLAQKNWSFRKKLAGIMVVIGILPVATLGIVTYLRNEAIEQQIYSWAIRLEKTDSAWNSPESTRINLEEVKTKIQEQSFWLLTATTIVTGLAGIVAFVLAEYVFRPILQLRTISQKVVKRLNPEENFLLEGDELTALETNLYAIEQQLPDLLWQQEEEKERFQLIIKIIQRLQQSRSVAEVFTQTTEAVRHAFQVERVAILYFNGEENGNLVAESVAANLPKILWTDLEEPLFEPEDLEILRQGKIRVIDDISQADLSDRYLNLLTKFAVKAYLIAPLIKDEQLYGLLIIHQCSYPRHWQARELDLISRITSQVGFALNYATLLEELDLRATRSQQFIELSRQIRAALTEEEIFKVTVEQMRKLLNCDRVMVYGFDSDWYGTVVAESVLPGFPKTLWAGIKDPCFAEGYVEKYQAGRVQAIANIHEAGLTECHLKQLEPFAVKANLVAPILKDDRLFGLLIAQQCSAPRDWQSSEIDLFKQIALQVGFALDRARLAQQLDTEVKHNQLLANITRSIRAFLVEEQLLKTTVAEVRKAINSDRVIVYSFDSDWHGTVVAESVLPGFPKALWAKIQDPCFAENYVEKYQAGRVQATNNVYEAGLNPCHLKQLEPFGVKAHLVAPIIQDNQLFGLLIAHQCTQPRSWQQWEINFFSQVAVQVGFALEHSRLLQETESLVQQQSEQKQALQQQISNLLYQAESIQIIYEQTQTLIETLANFQATIQQLETEEQQWQGRSTAIAKILTQKLALETNAVETLNQLQTLTKSFPQLIQILNDSGEVTSQIKVQGMNGVIETARSQANSPELATLYQKIHSLAQQLEQNLKKVQPTINTWQLKLEEATNTLTTNLISTDLEQLEQQAEQQIQEIATAASQIKTLLKHLAQNSHQQIETLTILKGTIAEIKQVTVTPP
jgi:twitching motility protein PilJ